MKHTIRLFILLCCIFPCFTSAVKASDTFTDGIVTKIPRQRFMTNLPPSEFDAGSDPAQLEELTALLDGFTIIVTCKGEDFELPMEISWNQEEIDFQTPGTYRLIGEILAPDGCCFADGVLTQIVMPIRIAAPPQETTHTLTMLHNEAPLLVGCLFRVGAYDAIKETKQYWMNLIPSISAYNEYGEFANLELDHIDDSRILPDTPGEYTATIFLRLPTEYDGVYVLDPAISTLHIPVKISASKNFELWMSHTTSSYFYLHFLPRSFGSVRIFRTQSPIPLSNAQLANASWTLQNMLPLHQNTYGVPRPLPLHSYVYFYCEDAAARSNIICLVDDGKSGLCFPIEGNRDGGDAIGNPAALQVPSHETESSILSPSISNDAPFDGMMEICGETLFAMMERGQGTARISNDGITASLRLDTLSAHPITNDSAVCTTLSFSDENQFVLGLSIDGVSVQELEDTKIQAPYPLQSEDTTLYLTSQDGEKIPADSYDSALQVATFTVGQCGTYTINEDEKTSANVKQTDTASIDGSAQSLIFACTAAAFLIFVFFKTSNSKTFTFFIKRMHR